VAVALERSTSCGRAVHTANVSEDFQIRATFLSKDPEWEVTYEERVGGDLHRCSFMLIPGELALGALDTWASPAVDIVPEQRARVLERVCAWAASECPPVSIDIVYDQAGPRAPLWVRGGYDVQLEPTVSPRKLVYRETGRSLLIPVRALVAAGSQAAVRLYPERAAAWYPTRDRPTRDEMAQLLERVRTKARATIEVHADDADVWRVARTLREWRGCAILLVPDIVALRAYLERQRPAPEQTVFWLLEVPALYTRGRTGWNSTPGMLSLGPASEGGAAKVRSWLFGTDLPLGVIGAIAETRQLVHAWTAARAQGVLPPPELADRVLGVIVERQRRSKQEGVLLAVYADGRIRYVDRDCVVIVEVILSSEVTRLAGNLIAAAQAAAVCDAEGEAGESRALRAWAITLSGRAELRVRAGDEIERAASAIVQALIERTLPLDDC
jgi:hypothetical protein